jgi:hypothetical protein
MKNNIFSAIIILCFFSSAVFAGGAGSSSGNFLKLGTGVRAAGMGDTGAACSSGAEAIYWNPAGIAGAGGEVLLSHTIWAAETSIETAGAVVPVSPGSNMGLLVNYFMSGTIDKVDNTGLLTGTYSNSDMSVALCFGTNLLSGVPLGLSVKYIGSTIDGTSATAFAADVGAKYDFGSMLTAGLAVQNIGMQLKYTTVAESLPLNIKAGVLFKADKSFLIAGDVNFPNDGSMGFSVGAEYQLDLGTSMTAALRAGYKSSGTGNLSGLSTGAGVVFSSFQLDYALVMFGVLGNNHRISLKVRI